MVENQSVLEKIWLPVRHQWATCYTRFYRKFGARVTSPTESTNLNVKSFLVNGRAGILRLIEALQALAQRQMTILEDNGL